ncbi:MAG: iron-sulfur cluster repair di-iron protein [Acidobacteriaceae bacterium]|nr:iron-sulfur cluster repair di-iron protein [Acidobacteriaceae bacterium]
MGIDTAQTVREIVQQNPAAVPVFEALGIDYCCGGGKSLEDACKTRNLPVDKVLTDLRDALVARPTKDDAPGMTSALSDLADHIVAQHHNYARRELTRLTSLAEKVFLRHGGKHPELGHIRDLVIAMSSEAFTHMLKEEQVLFPRLKTMEQAATNGTPPPQAFFGALINPIRHMMEDHDDTGELLRNIRSLTNEYQSPAGACMSFQALYHGLADLESDLHQHIHLENNILFPRALEFEKTQ